MISGHVVANQRNAFAFQRGADRHLFLDETRHPERIDVKRTRCEQPSPSIALGLLPFNGVEAGAWAVIFSRGFFAALSTTAWAASRHALRKEFLGMGWAGFAVGAIGAAGTAAFISAFKLTSIANVALIYAVAPFLAAMLAWLAIGETLTRRTAFGILGSVAGVAIIVAGSVGSVGLVGDRLALVMTLVMATIMVIYRARPDTPRRRTVGVTVDVPFPIRACTRITLADQHCRDRHPRRLWHPVCHRISDPGRGRKARSLRSSGVAWGLGDANGPGPSACCPFRGASRCHIDRWRRGPCGGVCVDGARPFRVDRLDQQDQRPTA